MKKELVLLFTIPAILINVVLVLASNQFENIFSNFDMGIIGFFISLIPAIILLMITYASFKKASVGLMTFQVLLWWLFTLYVFVRAFAFLDYDFNLGFMPKNLVDFFITDNVPTDPDGYFWYQTSIYINAAIGLIMTFGNGVFRRILVRVR